MPCQEFDPVVAALDRKTLLPVVDLEPDPPAPPRRLVRELVLWFVLPTLVTLAAVLAVLAGTDTLGNLSPAELP